MLKLQSSFLERKTCPLVGRIQDKRTVRVRVKVRAFWEHMPQSSHLMHTVVPPHAHTPPTSCMYTLCSDEDNRSSHCSSLIHTLLYTLFILLSLSSGTIFLSPYSWCMLGRFVWSLKQEDLGSRRVSSEKVNVLWAAETGRLGTNCSNWSTS